LKKKLGKILVINSGFEPGDKVLKSLHPSRVAVCCSKKVIIDVMRVKISKGSGERKEPIGEKLRFRKSRT